MKTINGLGKMGKGDVSERWVKLGRCKCYVYNQ